MADDRKACCKIEANLSKPAKYNDRSELTFRRCSVCKCRHFRVQAQGLGQPLTRSRA